MNNKSNNKTIPDGFMTVGELAKKMGVTVRTLQYYDKEGLLSPSAESEGGFRLYSYKDAVKLDQILSMKYLGFSLTDIKGKLAEIETPADMEKVLVSRAEDLRTKIRVWSQALEAIEVLIEEVKQMQTVDFRKYTAIITNLQMGNEYYGMIKHMDEAVLDRLSEHHETQENAKVVIDDISRLLNMAIRYNEDGIAPESEQGQELAKEFWEKTLEAMGGDVQLVAQMAQKIEQEGGASQNQIEAIKFIEPALEIYFERQGGNPFND